MPRLSMLPTPAAVAAGVVLAASVAVPTASAQVYRDRLSAYDRPDLYQRLRAKPPARRAKAPERTPAAPKAAAATQPAAPAEPLTLVVSVASQRVTVYAGTEEVTRASVSTGTRGHETPTGVFSVIQKERMHYSNLYNNAPMPFMQRITWSGVALHAGHLPGYPASHGCIRMPHEFARRLYGMTAIGARVIVTAGDPSPTLVTHQRLAALAPSRQVASAEQATARLDPPMHLGVNTTQPETPTEAAPAETSRSLLVRAQRHLAERILAVERLRTQLEAGARPLAEAAAVAQQARDAAATGRNEVARAKSAVRRIEIEIAAAEAGLKNLERTAERAPDNAAKLEDKLEDALQRLASEIEPARRTLEEHEETLREIDEELTQAESQRIGAQRAQEETAARLRMAEEDVKESRRDLARRQKPASLLFSRKTGKLYVRQGFEPLMETQASLDDPDAPVGTHVFTALAAGPGGGWRWSAVSVPSRLQGAELPPAGRAGRAAREEMVTRVARVGTTTAAAALDRLQIPQDVLAQIGDLIRPGSSLIVTDEPLSRETGKATDLIVQTR
jgi:lipoprotein-anchoring transpeptidase ErfK/SrfK